MVNYNIPEIEEDLDLIEEEAVIEEDIPVAASIEKDIPVAAAIQEEEDKPATYTEWKKGDLVTPGYFNNIGETLNNQQCCTYEYIGTGASIDGSYAIMELMFPFKPNIVFITGILPTNTSAGWWGEFRSVNPAMSTMGSKIIQIPKNGFSESDGTYLIGEIRSNSTPSIKEISVFLETRVEKEQYILKIKHPATAETNWSQRLQRLGNASGCKYTVTAFGSGASKYNYNIENQVAEPYTSGLKKINIFADGVPISDKSGKLSEGTKVTIQLDTLPDYEEFYAVAITKNSFGDIGLFSSFDALNCSFEMPSGDIVITIMDK